MARRIRLPGLGELADLRDSIRRRRGPTPATPAPPRPAPQERAPEAGREQPAPESEPEPQPSPEPAKTPPAATPVPPAAAPVAPTGTAPAGSAPAGLAEPAGTAPGATPPSPPPSGGLRRIRKPALIGVALLLAAGVGLGVGYLAFDESEPAPVAPVAPTVVVEPGPEQPDAASLGFPGFATLNTTRVGGADSTAVAAGAALAAYPSETDADRPGLVTLVPAGDWQAGVAASALVSEQVGSPILLSEPSEVPDLTSQALEQLDPSGLKRADGAQLLAVAGAEAPNDYETRKIGGGDAAELADEIDTERAKLSGVKNPDHILVASSKDAAFAMPAAAWAARSGDPVVFADGSEVPDATLKVLERHPKAPVYVLGPPSVISAKAVKTLAAEGDAASKDSATGAGGRAVVRVGAEDPVENAIEFARFVDGTFGWNINDPGHGFVIANTSRPADAGASAPLSAAGKPGPLLLTDAADEVPKPLANFLLDTKPGYVDDPTRAIYNHVWIVGDAAAVSIPFQAEVDRLTQLAKVSEGTGVTGVGPTPGTPEPEPPQKTPKSGN